MEQRKATPSPLGFLRLKQIIGDKKAEPPIQALIPVSPATWWNGVKSGRFPKSIKLTERTTVWRAEDIYEFIAYSGDHEHRFW